MKYKSARERILLPNSVRLVSLATYRVRDLKKNVVTQNLNNLMRFTKHGLSGHCFIQWMKADPSYGHMVVKCVRNSTPSSKATGMSKQSAVFFSCSKLPTVLVWVVPIIKNINDQLPIQGRKYATMSKKCDFLLRSHGPFICISVPFLNKLS